VEFSAVHKRIEGILSAWGHRTFRWRWAIVLMGFGLTFVFASSIPQLRSDNSAESYLRPGDPARQVYDRFREQFGQENSLLVMVRAPDLFNLAFLERLVELHKAIENEVPHVDEVTSLLNARSTRGEGDELIVEDLLEDWPATEANRVALKTRIIDTPVYMNTLVNVDMTVTTLTVIPFLYSTPETEAGVLAGFSDGPEHGPGRPYRC
jgi:predicted RND superfamily exporter protein